jgi:hypothetical protein
VSQSTHQRDIFHPPAFPDEVTGGWDSSWIGAEESPEEIHKGFERYAIDVRNSEVTMDNIQRLIEGVPAKPEDETTIRHIRELVNQFNGGMTELIPLAHGEESCKLGPLSLWRGTLHYLFGPQRTKGWNLANRC